MKVAVVVNCLKLGGMERVAVNLADAFAHSGHDCDLIYLKNREPQIYPSNDKVALHLFNLRKWVLCSGVGLFWWLICQCLNVIFRKTFPHFFAYAGAFVFRFKLKQLEKKHGRFDLVVFRGQGTFGQIWPLNDPRFVFVCESVQNPRLYKGLSAWIYRCLFANRRMVCVSNGGKESLLDLLSMHSIDAASVDKITNPNDYQLMRQQAQSHIELHDKPYILGLGRLVGGKNFALLIEAFAYAREHYDIKQDLVIVGDGRERNALELKVKQLDLMHCVSFKGAHKNPFPWYKGADLFVLSSKAEGLGMVLIEALACGTKVVATDCRGGVRDIIQGELVQFLSEQDAPSLAQKIHFALTTPQTEQVQQEIEQVLTQFDQEYIVSQYEQLYSSS